MLTWRGLKRAASHGPPVMRRLCRNYLLASLLAVAIATAVAALRRFGLLEREPWTRFTPLAVGVLPLLVFMPIWVRRMKHARREFDAADGRLCTHCGYNVGPLGDAGVCPECGERFEARADAATWQIIGFTVPEQ